MWESIATRGIAAQYPNFRPEHLDPGLIDLRLPIWEEDHLHDEEFASIWEESGTDRKKLEWLAKRFGVRRPEECWHMPSWNRARQLLTEHWGAVEAVAGALVKRGTLSGEEVRDLVQESSTVQLTMERVSPWGSASRGATSDQRPGWRNTKVTTLKEAGNPTRESRSRKWYAVYSPEAS